MTVTITIRCDNEAFSDNAGGEVARILCRLATDVNGRTRLMAGDERNLRDYNGNTVGRCTVSEE